MTDQWAFNVGPISRRAVLTFGLGAAVPLLASCGGGSNLTVVDLSAPTGFASGGRGQITIAEPTGLAIYETDRIVVREAAVVSVLPGVQWADRLPRLLQARMVQAFENAGRAASVGRPGDRLASERQLVAEIRNFEILAESREAVVTLSVKLVGERAGRVVGARIFTASEPAAAIDAAQAPPALDRALSRVLREVVAWAR